jgi:hypothetical protein
VAAREPMHLQANDYEAKQDRRLMSALLGYARFADLSPSTTLSNAAHGVCEAGHLKVTEKSGTPNMSVDVAAGAAFIAGTNASDQGCYFVENDATANVTIATADGTNPRIDVIVARVRDAAYSGADNDLLLTVVQGTPAASPAVPSLPDDCIALAQVSVPALDTAITNSQITDLRVASDVWKRPRGLMAAPISANIDQTLTGTTSDLTGYSFTGLSLQAGRRYKATLLLHHYDLAGAGNIQYVIADQSNNNLGTAQFRHTAAAVSEAATLTAVFNGSGQTSIKARGFSVLATGTNKAFASSAFQGLFVLEDIGGYLT